MKNGKIGRFAKKIIVSSLVPVLLNWPGIVALKWVCYLTVVRLVFKAKSRHLWYPADFETECTEAVDVSGQWRRWKWFGGYCLSARSSPRWRHYTTWPSYSVRCISQSHIRYLYGICTLQLYQFVRDCGKCWQYLSSVFCGGNFWVMIPFIGNIVYPANSAVQIVFFHFKLNRIVIVGLKSPVSKYLLNKFNCFYGTALLWFLL